MTEASALIFSFAVCHASKPASAADPAGLRQAIRSSQQDRCCECRGDLRGSWSTKHALRAMKSAAQQSALLHHSVRDLLVRQRRC